MNILIFTQTSLLCWFICVSPEESATRATVPGGPSIACSTAKAVEWDATWSKNLDPSGRAALGVHVASYEEDKTAAKNWLDKNIAGVIWEEKQMFVFAERYMLLCDIIIF